jgi:hypothetical protein
MYRLNAFWLALAVFALRRVRFHSQSMTENVRDARREVVRVWHANSEVGKQRR